MKRMIFPSWGSFFLSPVAPHVVRCASGTTMLWRRKVLWPLPKAPC